MTKQATRPVPAESIGLAGTAPGLVFRAPTGCVVVVLPGPPSELRRLWPNALASDPMRELLVRTRPPGRRVLRLFGVSESAVARALEEAGGDGDGVEATICAREFEIHVDLVVEPGAEERGDALDAGLSERLGQWLFARDERRVEELVLSLAGASGLRLTAESCTGGLVAARLTSVPGSSTSFVGGVVSYADEVKRSELDVPEELLATHGAVSAEVAAAMAEGARRRLGADAAVAVTGVAGPDGGTPEKPVGRVYLHAVGPDGAVTRMLDLPGQREQIRGTRDGHRPSSPACASDGKSRRIRMSSAASVSGDERLRLFLALRLPDDVLDEVERWQREHLGDVRVVPREHLHVTLAFLGHRPSGELETIVGALREGTASPRRGRSGSRRPLPRKTRSAGTLVFEDEGGHAALFAGDVQRAGRNDSASHRRRRRPWPPTSRWRGGASGRDFQLGEPARRRCSRNVVPSDAAG